MKLILVTLLMALSQILFSQIDYLNHQPSLEICRSKFELAISQNLREKPIDEIFILVAKSFVGNDYEGFVLEKPEKEEVFIYLQGLDCVSLIENSLVLARLIKRGDSSLDSYIKELEYIRYRDGIRDDYLSRLHYFSEWIANNEKKGILRNVSRDLGGNKLLAQTISFMSNNPKLYPKLKSKEDIVRLKQIENQLNSREIFYIGKTELASKSMINKIEDGDIVALVASDTTLDITHTAIAVKKNNNIHLLHAPKPGTKVQITEKPLYEYIKNNRSVFGIMIIRLIE